MNRLLVPAWTWIAVAALATPPFAVAQEPDSEPLLELMSQVDARLQAQEWAAALPLLERVVARNPHVAYYWYALGLASANTREYRRAAQAYERAYALGAGWPNFNVSFEIARAYGSLGERAG